MNARERIYNYIISNNHANVSVNFAVYIIYLFLIRSVFPLQKTYIIELFMRTI